MAGDWRTYFPFAKGDMLYIDGPWGYDGTGEVVENDGGILEVLIKMISMPIASIPQVNARLRIEIGPDAGMAVVWVTANSIEVTDHNATIKDECATRRVIPSLGNSEIEVTAISGHRAAVTVHNRVFTISHPLKRD